MSFIVLTFVFICRSHATIIDGAKVASEVKNEVKNDVEKWVAGGRRRPCLKCVLVGEDPASETYVRKKMEAAKFVGIDSETVRMSATSTENEIIAQVKQLNDDPTVDGVLVQLPLPKGVVERNVCNAVDPRKDVDGFHITNIGKLCLNMKTFIPATALGVVELLKRYNIETYGKNVVVCSRSKNIGLPLVMLLHSDECYELPGMEATTVLCHRRTPPEELRYFAKRADILISATGIVNFVKPDLIKPGACVIDVGINRITTPDGKQKLVGDVDYDGKYCQINNLLFFFVFLINNFVTAVKEVAGYITPVPGGVGPMTVAMLMKNTFDAAVDLAKASGNV